MINIYFSRNWNTLIDHNLYTFERLGVVKDTDNITQEEFSEIWNCAFKALKNVCDVEVEYNDLWVADRRSQYIGKVYPLEYPDRSRSLKFYIDMEELKNLENSKCLKITKWEF